MTTNIFLIGMPSSGKSTLGRQIAKSLGYEFVDLDLRIEIAEGKKIAEIFSLNGEEYFRKVENQQLKKIIKDSKMVVATGGGTPCYYDGLDYIKENGISIFLDVKPEMLVERMKVSKKNDRPLFDLESKSLLDTISQTYNERLSTYQKADITVEGDTDPDSILWIIEAEFSRK
ncbi:Shikimate kinase [Emticicia oligotrophica DSM 17448]|uniref:Shikimate kinase n=1 Tax=Emticicia oligotrophica (strain DSM 17448 / CIP 109782 / MTCC 6937 / GPTSA100-15) TaxID=929562 RepID=A0ABN4AR48_EMTOG|nr:MULTISPECIES: shikimate kinase [Emticicia]AFK04995.1 Shikimate kinase [Emticicia oligotrophica DSM 17448]